MDKQRKRKSALDRRAEIVDTVIELSAEIGPDRVTTQHLADAVGVTQPAIFRHFATKAEIWGAVGDRTASYIDECLPTEIRSDDPVRAYFRQVVNLLRTYPALPAIISSRELQADNESLRQTLANAMNGLRLRLEGMLKSGQTVGIYRSDVSAVDLSRIVTCTAQGLCSDWMREDRGFDIALRADELAEALSKTLTPC